MFLNEEKRASFAEENSTSPAILAGNGMKNRVSG